MSHHCDKTADKGNVGFIPGHEWWGGVGGGAQDGRLLPVKTHTWTLHHTHTERGGWAGVQLTFLAHGMLPST